jgi:hypothetical protein
MALDRIAREVDVSNVTDRRADLDRIVADLDVSSLWKRHEHRRAVGSSSPRTFARMHLLTHAPPPADMHGARRACVCGGGGQQVGDVCECLDMVGVPTKSLGRKQSGQLRPLLPGVYFKVRLEAVEFVWPGFTSETFPLIIAKVRYVGIDPLVKPPEWVASTRLRASKAARNVSNPAWRGWQVCEGALGRFDKHKFSANADDPVAPDQLVECLFPFTQAGTAAASAYKALPPPPLRLLDLAAANMAHEMLLAGDPDGQGMWEVYEPRALAEVPRLLVRLRRWDLLCGQRVLGSVAFLAVVVLEHGPDLLKALFDHARAAMHADDTEARNLERHPHYQPYASPWQWVGRKEVADPLVAEMLGHAAAAQEGGDEEGGDAQQREERAREERERAKAERKTFGLHRQFVHKHLEALRWRAVAELAVEGKLPAVEELYAQVAHSEDGLLAKVEGAIGKAELMPAATPQMRLVLLHLLRKLRHLRTLGLVQHPARDLTEAMDKAEARASAFLAEEAIEEGGAGASEFDEILAGVRKGGASRAVLHEVDRYSLALQADAPEEEEEEATGQGRGGAAVLRVEVDCGFFAEAAEGHGHVQRSCLVVASRVVMWLKQWGELGAAELRVLRVEAGYSADTNRLPSRTLVYVSVSGLPQPEVACAEVARALRKQRPPQDGGAGEEEAVAEAGLEASEELLQFAATSRSRFRMLEVAVVNASIFLSLVFVPTASLLHVAPGDELLLARALQWRSDLVRIFPDMTDEEVGVEVEELWFEQTLRDHMAAALELPTDKVLCLYSSLMWHQPMLHSFAPISPPPPPFCRTPSIPRCACRAWGRADAARWWSWCRRARVSPRGFCWTRHASCSNALPSAAGASLRTASACRCMTTSARWR